MKRRFIRPGAKASEHWPPDVIGKGCAADSYVDLVPLNGNPPGLVCIGDVGTTSERPALNGSQHGTMFIDSTIGEAIWWDGNTWRRASGAAA